MVISDKKLLENISKKDESAFKELYDRYSQSILKQVSSRIKDINAIEDLCQEFWLFVWTSSSLIRINEEGDASKSLFYILSKRILDYYRHITKSIIIQNENIENDVSKNIQYCHVFEDLVEKDIIELVDQLVNKLPQLDQKIYQLRIKRGYPIKETANQLSISEKTVQSHMTKITSEIRSQLTFISLFVNSSILLNFYDYLNSFL